MLIRFFIVYLWFSRVNFIDNQVVFQSQKAAHLQDQAREVG